MTIPEESRSEIPSAPAGVWHRRLFQAPPHAPWVPGALESLAGQPAVPSLRGLRTEPGGGWSIEEFVAADRLPLEAFLTKSAAPVWVFVSIVQQCLTGLIALHDRGIWHGAISPRTLLVDPAGQVVLAGCGASAEAPAWSEGVAIFNEAPLLEQWLATADLRDLGRVFRSVLGGDPDIKMTTSRPDIAPLVAEWIDWLADPPPGRAPSSASQAEAIFAQIRTGHPGWRPWRMDSEMPPEIDHHHSSGATAQERLRLARRVRLRHSLAEEWRGPMVYGLIILCFLAGGTWILHHFLSEQSKEKLPIVATQPLGAIGEAALLLDDTPEIYSATGGDIEPIPETEVAIAELIGIISKKAKMVSDWSEKLERQQEERERISKGETPEPGEGPQWLYDPLIFPTMGKPSPGRAPGDYYLVWRTQNVILTMEESFTLQAAILRSARYCGVRVMAWTVLPNHAAVVLRVPQRKPLADEKLERRISILRGEKIAAGVIARVNEKLKAGDQAGAELERRPWTASMGSVAGFFSVVKTVPVIALEVPGKATLWQAAPLHLSVLDPDTPDLLRAAAIVDTAPVKARLVELASEWPSCSLTAAMINYGPALRAISVLMQRNPQSSLPVPPKEDLVNALGSYRRYLGDLPPEEPAPAAPPDIAPAPPAADAPLPVSSVQN